MLFFFLHIRFTRPFGVIIHASLFFNVSDVPKMASKRLNAGPNGHAFKRAATAPCLLFLSLSLLCFSSVLTIYYQSSALAWLYSKARHHSQTHFSIRTKQGTRSTSWLPPTLSKSPQHHLALVAACACIGASIIIASLYVFARRTRYIGRFSPFHAPVPIPTVGKSSLLWSIAPNQ